MPLPPIRVSSPASPFRLSLPPPPDSTLAAALPTMVSLPPPPVTFSIETSVSTPASPADRLVATVAVVVIEADDRLTVTLPVEPSYETVSEPLPPSIRLSPAPLTMVSLFELPITFSMDTSVSVPAPVAIPVRRFTVTALPLPE